MASEPLKPPARIGLVGLGQMGVPMARNLLQAGFALAVFDTNAQAVRSLCDASAGALAASSLRTLAQACAAVITMLPNGAIVREVVLDGAHRLAVGLAKGSVVIDMSSSSPVGTRDLGAALAERGVALIDAPVSGGVKRAIDGSLAIMAGGDARVIDRCEPVLAAMGQQIFRPGGLATGHAMKALNNYVSAAGFAAAAEAVLTRKFAAGFSLGLMVKDLRTALEVARATGMPAPMAETTVELWARSEELLGPQADHTAMAQYIEHLAGSTIADGEVGKS